MEEETAVRHVRGGAARDIADPTACHRSALRLDAIVGKSRALAKVFERVSALAPFEVTVLLTGRSGTGKTQLARAIHDNSARANRPFVELSCANLPDALLENELFGALRGGHATASSAIQGKVAMAEHGTLFLDEIGELSLVAQAKLLQLLQSRAYYALGSPRAQAADIRLIAATNRDLADAVEQRTFREDLYYRLNAFPIHLPSLAERPDDVPHLARSVCRAFCKRHGLEPLDFSWAAMALLQTRRWPGNVRELGNTIERALILARSDGLTTIEPRHLGEEMRSTTTDRDSARCSFAEEVERYKRQLLLDALERNSWNVTQTAHSMRVCRSYLYKLMEMLQVARPDGSAPVRTSPDSIGFEGLRHVSTADIG